MNFLNPVNEMVIRDCLYDDDDKESPYFEWDDLLEEKYEQEQDDDEVDEDMIV